MGTSAGAESAPPRRYHTWDGGHTGRLRQRWRRLVPVALICLVTTGALAFGAARLCAGPISLTSPLPFAGGHAQLPVEAQLRPLVADVNASERRAWTFFLTDRLPDRTLRDRVAYWYHAAFGAALDWLHCTATASGVQWVKAAIHARSPGMAVRASEGIHRAVARTPEPDAVAYDLCLAGSPRVWTAFDHVALTFALAGVYCDERMAPARVLGARTVPDTGQTPQPPAGATGGD